MSEFKAELIAGDGSRVALSAQQSVGRGTQCEICIDDSRVSRVHAIIRVEGERITVEDKGSANGTRINDFPINGVSPLANGDSLSFEKHTYVVAITGGSGDMDATQVDSDATMVNSDATVVSMPEPAAAVAPPPAAAPEAAPAPASEVPATPSPAPDTPTPRPTPLPGAADLPGSWVESGSGEHTQVLGMGDMGNDSATPLAPRATDLPHFIILSAEGSVGEVLELQPQGGDAQDVWEVGRAESSEIQLEDPSVSARHAQLIHQGGRWRMVNLVSANGIFVNGEKRLTAYLSDGDEVRLGAVQMVFYTAAGGVVSNKAATSASASASKSGGGSNKLVAIGAVLAVAVLAAAAWLLL